MSPRADFEFLIQGEIVHPDGAARVGGLCNSDPEKAVAYQQDHGEADLYVWDCPSYHGKDISQLPYRERHVNAARLVEELRPYSEHIQLAEEMPAGGDPAVFYDCVVSDQRGLPFSEGVVVKDLNDPTGCTFYKVKARVDHDWEIADGGILEGAGKHAGSCGAIRVQHPETGARSELGSLAVSDNERQWIWDHRGDLEGQVVAKFEAMEITGAGAVRAGTFRGLHQSKGDEDVLRLIGSYTTQV